MIEMNSILKSIAIPLIVLSFVEFVACVYYYVIFRGIIYLTTAKRTLLNATT
jgi:hypothetical protein